MPEPQTPMTDEEAEEILRTFSESKSNVHTFLTQVVKAKDNTKIGNVTKEELGSPNHTVRMYKELSVFSDNTNMPYFSDYFKQMADVSLATGLSKDGFLIDRAVLQKRELSSGKKVASQNRGWFRPKRQAVEDEEV